MKREYKKTILILFSSIILLCNSASASATLKGVWHLQDRKMAHVALEKAITDSTQKMSFFIRRKGRSILENEADLCYRFTLAETRKDFVWQCDSKGVNRVSVKANKLRSNDSEQGNIKTTYKKDKNSATITVESEFAVYTYSWSLLTKQHLKYTETIKYEKIPTPLKWTFIYSKVMR